jgi:hypothetical protein
MARNATRIPNAAFGRNQRGIPDSRFEEPESFPSRILNLEFGIPQMRARRRDRTKVDSNAVFGRNQTAIQNSRFKIQKTGIISLLNLES